MRALEAMMQRRALPRSGGYTKAWAALAPTVQEVCRGMNEVRDKVNDSENKTDEVEQWKNE